MTSSRRLPLIASVIAGALAGGVLALIISNGSTTTHSVTTTVIRQAGLPTSLNSARGESINQIYKSAGPGVVDIIVTTQSAGGFPGFGGSQQQQGEGAGVVFDNK